MARVVARIAWHECRLLWRDQRFRWAASTLGLLLIVAGAVSANVVDRRSAAIAAAQHEQREQWLQKRVSNAHVAAHAGITVFRLLHPLAIVDSGIDDVVGQSVCLEPHRRSFVANSAAERTSMAPQFAQLTIAVTLQTLVPLLIVLLTFTAIAAEREHGTLRLLVSLGVRPATVVLGKALGLTAPLLIVTVPAMCLSLLIVHMRGAVDASRAGLLILTYVLYLCLLVGVGLLVSARSRTTSGALIALLGFWLVVSVMVPRGAFALAQRVYPVPTAEAFATALETIDRAGNVGFMQQRSAVERRLLAAYRVTRPTDLPVSTWGVTLYEREVESTARYNAEFARIYDAYDRQQRLVDLISIGAPPLALRSVSMALAGTDTAHYRHFAEAAEAYRYALVQVMNTVAVESRLYNSSRTLADAPDQPAFPDGESTAYARVGAFAYHAPGSAWVLKRVAVPAGALVAWSVVTGAALIWAVRRVSAD
jgi:ABC-2 type transport system permease protein